MRILLVLVAFLLTACTAPVTSVTPYADVAPEPQPQALDCGLSAGEGASFTLECSEPLPTPTVEPTETMTPEPTPTEAPSFYYFWCDGDARCASGQFRVYWDRDLTMLRCALTAGSKVSIVADGYSMRLGEGEPLAWVVTGADSGGRPCEGWTPESFLRAAE